MRNERITLTITNPKSHVITSMHPISRGPYGGYDLLMLMDNLCGKAYVIRATVEGEHRSSTEMVSLADGPALVQSLLIKQGDADCSAVTGGGRWGSD